MRICEHFMRRRFNIVYISRHYLYIIFSFNIILYAVSSVSTLCTNYIRHTLHFIRDLQHTINLPPFAKHTQEILQTGQALGFSLFTLLTAARDHASHFHFSLLVHFSFISSDASRVAHGVSSVS